MFRCTSDALACSELARLFFTHTHFHSKETLRLKHFLFGNFHWAHNIETQEFAALCNNGLRGYRTKCKMRWKRKKRRNPGEDVHLSPDGWRKQSVEERQLKRLCNTAEATIERGFAHAGWEEPRRRVTLRTDGFEGAGVGRPRGTFSLPWLAGASPLVHISVCSRSALLSDPWRPSPLQWAHRGCRAPGNAAGVPELPALQSARTEGRKLKAVAEATKTALRLCGGTENADAGHSIIAPAFEKRRAEKSRERGKETGLVEVQTDAWHGLAPRRLSGDKAGSWSFLSQALIEAGCLKEQSAISTELSRCRFFWGGASHHNVLLFK